MPNKVLNACKDELQLQNCGFSHLPPVEFVKSQWQTRTKSKWFVIYRLSLAIFFIAIVINSMVCHITLWPGQEAKYFIYLTNWGILLCLVTTTIGALLVSMWYFHPEYADSLNETDEMPVLFKIYWIFHTTTLILSLIITIIYWAILFNDETPLDANNVLTHAFNSVFMILDLLIVAYPIRIWHLTQPITAGMSYCLFSVVYYIVGGTDMKNRPYIYNVLDWTKPKLALTTVIGTIILGLCLHTTIFCIYKIRCSIYTKFYSTKIITPTNLRLHIQPVACDGISMVHGSENKGYSSSLENIS